MPAELVLKIRKLDRGEADLNHRSNISRRCEQGLSNSPRGHNEDRSALRGSPASASSLYRTAARVAGVIERTPHAPEQLRSSERLAEQLVVRSAVRAGVDDGCRVTGYVQDLQSWQPFP